VAPWTLVYNDGISDKTLSGITTSPYRFTATTAGTFDYHLVSIAGNGCSKPIAVTGDVSITVHPLPTLTLAPSQTITLGDQIDLMTLTGTAPWEVVYNDGSVNQTITVASSPYVFAPTVAGAYTFNMVSVSDANGCINMIGGGATITVTSNLNNDASLTSLSVDQGTLEPAFTATNLYYTVTVPLEIDRITISASSTDPNASVEGTGNFALSIGGNSFPVKVTAEDGITEQTYVVMVYRNQTNIETVEVSENINVYPNPTQDMLNVVSDLQITHIAISDMNGKIVKQVLNPGKSISVADLATGVYVLQIYTDKGVAIKKITKQ
jgi:hypothetical protein